MDADAPTNLTEKETTVRCYATTLEWSPVDGQRRTLRKASQWESRSPIYITFRVDRAGLYLACASAAAIAHFIGCADNEARYRLLNDSTGLEPVAIPVPYFGLYYVSYRREGDFAYSSFPANSPGFTGALSRIRESEDLRIVIVCTALLDPALKQKIIEKKRPLQLELEVMDAGGGVDPAATRALYNAILAARNSAAAAQICS
jgi:hypothetical protein